MVTNFSEFEKIFSVGSGGGGGGVDEAKKWRSHNVHVESTALRNYLSNKSAQLVEQIRRRHREKVYAEKNGSNSIEDFDNSKLDLALTAGSNAAEERWQSFAPGVNSLDLHSHSLADDAPTFGLLPVSLSTAGRSSPNNHNQYQLSYKNFTVCPPQKQDGDQRIRSMNKHVQHAYRVVRAPPAWCSQEFEDSARSVNSLMTGGRIWPFKEEEDHGVQGKLPDLAYKKLDEKEKMGLDRVSATSMAVRGASSSDSDLLDSSIQWIRASSGVDKRATSLGNLGSKERN